MPTNKEYVDAVNEGKYPEDIRVPIDPRFVDDRGSITNMWLGNSGSTTVITSKKGSVRAQHYHEGDWHATYVVSGSIKYTESNIDGSDLKEYTFEAGQSFFSPPMKWHKMEFPSDCVFITMNGISKSHANYEGSVVRKEF
jgi:quercetin dioxygenase-like cupin family protein